MGASRIALFSIAASLVAGCPRACAKPVERPTLAAHAQHEARNLTSHPVASAATLAERLMPATGAISSYIAEENALRGEVDAPTAHALSADERTIFDVAIASLPAKVDALARRAVASIVFVDGLRGVTLTTTLRDPSRRSMLVFDASLLKKDVNQWASEKDRTAFEIGANVEVLLARPEAPTRGSAFRFALLHAIGRAVGAHLGVYASEDETKKSTPFSELSWRLEGDRFVPLEAPWPEPFSLYGAGPLRPIGDVGSIYRALSRSRYPSLHATLGVEEDFAETFAIYVHVVLLEEPYMVLVRDDATMTCINAPPCEAKKAFVAALLAQSP